jgi:hypothetical protein
MANFNRVSTYDVDTDSVIARYSETIQKSLPLPKEWVLKVLPLGEDLGEAEWSSQLKKDGSRSGTG